MKSLNKSLGKVSRGVPTISGFTFVPAVQKLPIKGVFTEENFAASHENSAEETMADGDVLRAEIIFIKDSLEGGAGNAAPAGTTFELKAALDHTSLPQTSAPVGGQSENTPRHEAPGTAAMETTANKHRGISQQRCHHPAGRAEPHKIKMSYKSLAAIPTNTLLLDQQVIDEQVERDDTTCDPPGRGAGIGDADTHAEMCSPAQLRQQSEELYATIDEILANSLPASQTSSRTPATDAGLQNNSSFPKSLGRETKYASICSLHPSAAGDRKLMDTKQTKPGVIRPMSASPRLMLEDEKYQQKPLRQSGNKQGGTLSLGGTGRSWTLREQRQPGGRFLPGDLQITEPGDQMDHPGKDAVATSFSAAARRMDAFETHI